MARDRNEGRTIQQDDPFTRALVRSRSFTVLDGDGGGGSREAVLKVLSCLKGKESVKRAVAYIARAREQDRFDDHEPPLVWDEVGRIVPTEEAVSSLGDWDLLEDDENLSRKARGLSPEAVAVLPPSERFHYRQAYHLAFSVVMKEPEDRGRVELAVGRAVADVFRDHRVIWAVHDDHSHRPHAHMVVKALNDRTGRRLRFGQDTPRAMREAFTRHAREQGLDVIATAREDRRSVQEAVLAGEADLAPRRGKTPFVAAHRDLFGTLALSAPVWSEMALPGADSRMAEKERRDERAEILANEFLRQDEGVANAATWQDLHVALAQHRAFLHLEKGAKKRRLAVSFADGGTARWPRSLKAMERDVGERFVEMRRKETEGVGILDRILRRRNDPGVGLSPEFVNRGPPASLDEMMSTVFREPRTAMDSFLRLRSEMKEGRALLARAEGIERRRPESYAEWLLAYRPELFGQLRLPVNHDGEIFLRLVRRTELPTVAVPRDEAEAVAGRRGSRIRRRPEKGHAIGSRPWRRDVKRVVGSLRRIADGLEEGMEWDAEAQRRAERIRALADTIAKRAVDLMADRRGGARRAKPDRSAERGREREGRGR